jgi:hypothetical protein
VSNTDPRRDGDGEWLEDQGDVAPAEALAAIQQAIRAAGDYVVPSEDLRPKTLEAARQLCEDRQGGIRFGRFAALLLLCMVVSVPIAERLTAWYDRVASPSSSQLQQQALQISSDRDIGPHWGLFEAFSQLRRSQAARLGHSAVPSSMQ